MYETILVPTDGSEHAVRAAEHALVLGEAFDADVHAVHVVDLETEAGPFSVGGVDEEYLEQVGRDALDTVEEVASGSDRLKTELLEGKATSAILDYVDREGVDMLAMGTHGRTGLNRYVTGSVTERVVRKADVPVMTVRATEGNRPEDYDDVMVPTDGSESAVEAVDHALAIAAAFDARVHAVNIVDVGSVSAGPGYPQPNDTLANLASQGERATEQVTERAEEAGLEAVTEVREGFPTDGLLEYAEEAGVDLITMGTRGRTGLNRYLLGSTTERVLRHAPVPVVAVNARNGQ